MLTPETQQKLFEVALAAQKRAYAPYSNYLVGAALLTADGSIFSGCNVENAAYPASICAERTALVKAVSEGYTDSWVALSLVTRNGGTPCGICRQMLNEFHPELPIYIYNETGELVQETTLDKLLPQSFRPSDLNK